MGAGRPAGGGGARRNLQAKAFTLEVILQRSHVETRGQGKCAPREPEDCLVEVVVLLAVRCNAETR